MHAYSRPHQDALEIDPTRAEEEYVAAQVSIFEEEATRGSRDAWSQQTEVSLDSRYRELIAEHSELDIQLQEVDCSAALRRVVLSSTASQGPAEALPILAEAVEWTGGRLFQAIPGDDSKIVMFAARENFPAAGG